MTPEEREAVKTHAVQEYIHERRAAFVEYVREQAGHVVAAERTDLDAIRDAVNHLSAAGYPVDDKEEPDPVGFASPADDNRLADEVERWRRLDESRPLRVDGVEFYADASIPEGTLLVVHPHAAAPTFPAFAERPWLVRDSEGVVRVEVET